MPGFPAASASAPTSLLWGGSGVPGIQTRKEPCVQAGEGPSVSWTVYPLCTDFSTVQFFVIVIKCQFEYIFLWSIYYGNLLVTNSPVSGVTSISLEERLGSFFPYQW